MFYINMGGGEEREVIDGDICFGKVVEGRDVLDAIVRNKGLFSMVGIQSVEAINESV
jgi:cyclophilin family peptidyl-prolyl cis-trans isomerase